MTKKKVTIPIAIPTLHCYDKLARLCSHLDRDEHEYIGIEFYILDNGGRLSEHSASSTLKNLESPIYTAVPSSNLGVAASWNYFVKELGRCIIANDDALFSRKDIELFLNAATESPDSILFEPANDGGGFTVIYINQPEQWMTHGGFDEAFSPAYFEDNDARWRLKLMNNPCVGVYLFDWSHDNSSTLYLGSQEYQQRHWSSFKKNQLYYQEKWGGMPNAETFSTPFNK